jgi:hypothetical protein
VRAADAVRGHDAIAVPLACGGEIQLDRFAGGGRHHASLEVLVGRRRVRTTGEELSRSVEVDGWKLRTRHFWECAVGWMGWRNEGMKGAVSVKKFRARLLRIRNALFFAASSLRSTSANVDALMTAAAG